MWHLFPFSILMSIQDSLVKRWLFLIFLFCFSSRIFPNWILLKLHLITLCAFQFPGIQTPPKKSVYGCTAREFIQQTYERSTESCYCKLFSCQNSFLEQSGIKVLKLCFSRGFASLMALHILFSFFFEMVFPLFFLTIYWRDCFFLIEYSWLPC